MSTSRSDARSARRLTAALIASAIGLLGVVPLAQAEVRVGDNYRLPSDPTAFRGKDAVALAVNPANPNHIVEANINYHTEVCEATASFDGGNTWTQTTGLNPPAPAIGAPFLPTCRIPGHAADQMFQTVVFGTGLNVYTATIAAKPFAPGSSQETGASIVLFRSTNGGVTWQPIEAMAGGPGRPTGSPDATTGPNYELPTVAVDPGAGTGGNDRVYLAAREVTGIGNAGPTPGNNPSARMAVSNDGGQTFGSVVQVSPSGVPVADVSEPVVGPDHSVGISWRTRGTVGEIQFARSTTAGATWSAPVTVTGVTNNGLASSSHVTPSPSSGSTFPRLAIDKTTGRIYIVYNQGAPGPTGTYLGADHFITPDTRVYFQRSVDNGATWSTPKPINDFTPRPGTPTVQTRHPNVDVAPGGRVDVVWEDRRHWYQGPGERNCVHTHIFCDDARLGDTYWSYSTNGGTTFSENRRISDRSHNNDVGYDYRFGIHWNFGPRSAAMGNDKLVVGWMDSREGSFDTDNEDIYLARVDLEASGPDPQHSVAAAAADPVARSVALSKFGYPGGGESALVSSFATRNATKVVIVNESDTAGALAGAVLARANVAPVLLSPASGLPDSVKSEIARLNPAGAFIIGDTGKLSAQIEADLAVLNIQGPQVERLSGSSDAETAALIAARMDRRSAAEKAASQPAFDAAVIANPDGPDAAAAAALAAARRLPFLYVSAAGTPASTNAQLSSLNINRTLVIGGAGQVSNTTLTLLPNATRHGGSNQYETSEAVAQESKNRGLPDNTVYVADGSRPVDAALLGAVVGRLTGIMLLSPSPDTGAAGAAAAAGLTGVDRFVVMPAPPADAPPPPPPAAGTPPAGPPPPPAAPPAARRPAVCGTVRLVRRNTTRSDRRVDTRVLLPCAGRLTARATVALRVRGRLRPVRQRVAIRTLSGRNRAIRVTLSRSARVKLRRSGRLKVVIKTRFVPTTLSATSRVSTRTINVTMLRGSRR